MKLIDLINESREERMTSKAKTIFKVFRKGTVGSKDNPNEPMFSYELSDDISVDRNNAGIILFTDRVKIVELNRACRHTSVAYMADKIRKRFQDFGIILTHPTIDKEDVDTDLERERSLNESLSGFIDTFTPEQKERLYKKAKTIYKVFRKGKITRIDGVSFSYELGDFMRPRIDDEGDLELFALVETITELTYCPINHRFMTELIEEKFKKMFGIKIELNPPHESNLVKWTGRKPWDKDEPTELNEEMDNELSEKDRKKIELIYGLFKRGKYTVEDILYNYVLPEEYWTSNNKETGELIVVLTMDPTQKMKLYAKMRKEDGDLYHREVPVEATQYESLYNNAKERIKNNFERFNIEIVF
jgi:hypothetical protein